MGRCLEVGTPGVHLLDYGSCIWKLRALCEAKSRCESHGSRGAGPSVTESCPRSSTFMLLHRANPCSCCLSDRSAVLPTSSHFYPVQTCAGVLSRSVMSDPVAPVDCSPLVSFSPQYYSSKNTGTGHHCYSSKHTSVLSRSAGSDSLWPCGLKPAWLLCPWDYPSKNTGVGSPFLLQPNICRYWGNTCLDSENRFPYTLNSYYDLLWLCPLINIDWVPVKSQWLLSL